ncbi:MAG: DUF5615 family PIN-like protein [Saprospiraceae bacterium]|nr:DUF5615 family PIN-like protein [Saprospiraceae bacterium]
MNFIADEGLDKTLVMLLRASGHDVFYFAEEAQSTDDETILDFANKENRILLTRDKDFGELIYRFGCCTKVNPTFHCYPTWRCTHQKLVKLL